MYNSRNKDKIQIHKQYLKKQIAANTQIDVYSNKKKIRNWPTILKNLKLLEDENLFGSVQEMKEMFTRSNYNYMKIDIDPFSRIEKRNPPQWFRKLIIQTFIEVYNNWHFYAENLSAPYYLKLWISDEYFSSSQIVMGCNDRVRHYQNLFKPHETNKPFPHKQYSSENCDTTQFNWKYAKEFSPVDQEDLDTINTKHLNKLLKENRIHPYYGFKDIYPNKEMFLIHVDNLWVGERL